MSDTATQTRRPTPAQDAAVNYEPIAAEARRKIYEITALDYDSWPASAVKEKAKELPYYHGKITTKQHAIDALAFAAWRGSEEHKTALRLQREATKEDEIYNSIDASEVLAERARMNMVAHATDKTKRHEQIMWAVAQSRKAQVTHWLWKGVEDWITHEDGMAPIEALEKIKASVIRDLTSTSANRAESRSTSLLANFDRDLEREAKAEWLDGLRWVH